jgi:hypothetical protein
MNYKTTGNRKRALLDDEAIWEIRRRLRMAAIPHEGKHYWATMVRLFANYGGPTNYVILGDDIPGPPIAARVA